MLALSCAKCGRRFTPTTEEIQNHLADSKGKKHVLVLCPHCGKGNKVDVSRLQQAVRFAPAESVTAQPPATDSEPAQES